MKNLSNDKYYYKLSPDHFSDLGERAEYDTRKPYGQELGYLHIHLSSPLEADLHQGYGCFICSQMLVDLAIKEAVNQFFLTQCEITWEPELGEYYRELIPPQPFYRIHPTGMPFVDDLALDDGNLIASNRFVEILGQLHYNHCDTQILRGGAEAEKLITNRRSAYW